MKKIMNMAIFAILAAACSNETEFANQVNNNDTLVPVRVHVDGFNVGQEEFPATRATALTNYDDVNAVTLAFYDGNTEKYKVTQLRSDNTTYTTFGSFNLSLPMGSYTMVVVAYYTNENSVLTLTSPTEASFSPRARETFATTQTVNITSTDAVDISATLDRIISCLKVVSTDNRTANVSNVRMTLSAGGKSFNPTTGLATVNTGFTNTVSISAAPGNPSNSTTYLFLATDEQTMNVTIETLDAQGNTLTSSTVNNVPFKRNRVTILTGAMYTNSGIAGSFQVNTTWLTDASMSF